MEKDIVPWGLCLSLLSLLTVQSRHIIGGYLSLTLCMHSKSMTCTQTQPKQKPLGIPKHRPGQCLIYQSWVSYYVSHSLQH
uniref:Uncharacterized protein n=1 Tax=Rhizophora mucronata TaxID=61149 RepID=A0A2P2R317_RHIMU